MPTLSDLQFPVTPKQLGPMGNQVLTRPKVFYLKSSDLIKQEVDATRGSAVIWVKSPRRKVVLYETPDEFSAAQALAQGATASPNFVKHYQALTPTSSATAADQNVASKYYNEVSTINSGNVRLPDPFARRLVVINNFTTGTINVFGRGATTPISGTGAASTAGYAIGPLERVHFLAPTAATAGTTAGWVVCRDAGTV